MALAEMVLCSAVDEAVGADVDLEARLSAEGATAAASGERPGAAAGAHERACRVLFCENGGYVVEVSPDDAGVAEDILERRGAWYARIGTTTRSDSLVIRTPDGEIDLTRDDMQSCWSAGARDLML